MIWRPSSSTASFGPAIPRSRHQGEGLPIMLANANDGEVRPVGRQNPVLFSSFSYRSHGGIDQSKAKICELRVELQSADEIRWNNRFQLIGRRRVQELCDELSHRRPLVAQKVVHFGQHESRDNDGGSLGESCGVLGPCWSAVLTAGQGSQQASCVGNETSPQRFRSLNNSDSSPNFKSVDTKRPVEGGRRLV